MGIVVVPNTWNAGDILQDTALEANFSTIYNEFNGNIDDTNIKSGAAIAQAKIASLVADLANRLTLAGGTLTGNLTVSAGGITVTGSSSVAGGFVVSTTTGTLRMPTLTTVQRDLLTPANGDMIYNSTTASVQMYSNGSWQETTPSGAVPDASEVTKGKTRLTVAPASATDPVAVGDNDGRVPTQGENDALAGTSGTPSSSNKYVTNADTSATYSSGKVARYGTGGSGIGADVLLKSYTAAESIAAGDAVFASLDNITRDSSTIATGTAAGGVATVTLPITMPSTSLNSMQFVFVLHGNTGNLTVATQNGVALTAVAGSPFTSSGGGFKYSVYYNLLPATGDLVITRGTTTNTMYVSTVTYTGALQSGQPDVVNKNTTNAVASATTVAANVRCVAVIIDDNGLPTIGAGSTLVTNSDGAQLIVDDANLGPKETAGLVSFGYSSPGPNRDWVVVGMKPVVGTVVKKAQATSGFKSRVVGYAQSAIANGASGLVAVDGVAATSTTPLVPNTPYFLSDTAGAVATTPGTVPVFAGFGASTTALRMASGHTPDLGLTGVASWQPVAATSGTDTTPANGTQFVASVYVHTGMKVTNINYLIGSVGGTDRVYGVLYDAYGNNLANTTLASSGTVVGTAANLQTLALTSPLSIRPGRYFVGISMNGNTARLRTVPAFCQAGILGGSVAQTHASVAAITPPSTFTADLAPVVFLN